MLTRIDAADKKFRYHLKNLLSNYREIIQSAVGLRKV